MTSTINTHINTGDLVHVKMIKSAAKDFANVVAGVEKGQSVSAYTLTEARNFSIGCMRVEQYLVLTSGGQLDDNSIPPPTVIEAADSWNLMVMAVDKACKKGAFGINDAAGIHQSIVKVSNAIRSALQYSESKAAESKTTETKTVKLAPPEDNIAH